MTFKLTIETGNAAFDGDYLPAALAGCIRDAASQVHAGRMSGKVQDLNGNTVGAFDTLTDAEIGAERAERATILAALRFYQEKGQGEPGERSDAIHDIATDGGEVVSLDAAGIDDLCEKLNR